jgi:hypothetical protein
MRLGFFSIGILLSASIGSAGEKPFPPLADAPSVRLRECHYRGINPAGEFLIVCSNKRRFKISEIPEATRSRETPSSQIIGSGGSRGD